MNGDEPYVSVLHAVGVRSSFVLCSLWFCCSLPATNMHTALFIRATASKVSGQLCNDPPFSDSNNHSNSLPRSSVNIFRRNTCVYFVGIRMCIPSVLRCVFRRNICMYSVGTAILPWAMYTPFPGRCTHTPLGDVYMYTWAMYTPQDRRNTHRYSVGPVVEAKATLHVVSVPGADLQGIQRTKPGRCGSICCLRKGLVHCRRRHPAAGDAGLHVDPARRRLQPNVIKLRVDRKQG
jgi:hypothetical protein